MTSALERHYGMDWLRIGAFALLILYHIGMVFVPWGWHVKSPVTVEWLTVPMLGTNSWRLPLLFVVSGFASRMLIERRLNSRQFVQQRTARLLLPVLFGIIFIIPVQPWIELTTQHSYSAGFAQFWLTDYFRFGAINGVDLPTWQHLWFVVYIWAYSVALPLFTPSVRAQFQPVFDRVFRKAGILFIPMIWGIIVSILLAPGEESNHALVGDAVGHLTYIPAFLFGVGLAGSRQAMLAAARYWKLALALATIAFVALCYALSASGGNHELSINQQSIIFVSRSIMGWSMIVALIGIADTFWNLDHPWRPTLTEAVFPFYIIHQTVIVIAGWCLLQWSIDPQVGFWFIFATTVAGCAAFYFLGRSINILRPLIGLRRS
jgi:glucans biosynthesis protein C